MEIEVSDEVKLEVEHLEDFSFLLDNVLGRNSEVGNLLGNNLGVERKDILILGGHVKAGDSEWMHILVLEADAELVTGNEVLVHDDHCEEVSSLGELEADADLDHPVDHFGPVLLGHIMTNEGLSGCSHNFILLVDFVEHVGILCELLLVEGHLDLGEALAVLDVDLLLSLLAELGQLSCLLLSGLALLLQR